MWIHWINRGLLCGFTGLTEVCCDNDRELTEILVNGMHVLVYMETRH